MVTLFPVFGFFSRSQYRHNVDLLEYRRFGAFLDGKNIALEDGDANA